MSKEIFNIHTHSDYSNLRLKDATSRVEDILEYSLELGLPGIALTDHEALSGHIKVDKHIKDNADRFKDFTVAYGNEIYLIDKEEESKREDNERIQYYHFLLLAKNQRGYEFLRRQSTQAWKNSYYYKGMNRVPTYYDELKEMIKGYEDDVIMSNACLGSHLNQLILQYHENKTDELKMEIHKIITYFTDLVGKDNFYLELQPAIKHDKSNEANKKEQQIVNDMLLVLAKAYGLTATGAIGVLDALAAEDRRAHREVGPLDDAEEGFESLFLARLRVGQQPLCALGDLTQVVGRNVRGHTHGDACRAVDQQVREPGGQNHGFLVAAVVVVLEVDGAFFDVPDHLHGQGRHLALGITRCGRSVVARGAEVALTGHERVAHRPRLYEADHGVVDRRVAVRVVLAHHVADDARALGEVAVGAVPAVEHRVEHAAMDGLESVADVGQGTADDHAHRVIEVRPLHLEVEINLWSLRPRRGEDLDRRPRARRVPPRHPRGPPRRGRGLR